MIINRILVLLTPHNKPPFIGIGYEAHCGFGSHEHMHLIHHKQDVSMLMEVGKESVNIQLFRRGFNQTDSYCEVAYNASALEAWLLACSGVENINFGHVQTINGKLVLCRTHVGDLPFFLPLYKIILLSGQRSCIVREYGKT